MQKVNFDDYVDEYDNLLQQETGFFTKSEKFFAQYKADIALKLIGQNIQSVLEFGCGTGRNLPFLTHNFPEAIFHGSDISAKSLEEAKQLNPSVDFYLDDGSKPIGHKYDFIFIAGVFHHIQPSERDDVILRLKEILKPNGKLLIFEHNPYNPITRRIVSNCPYDEDAVLLKPGQFYKQLTDNGLKILKLNYTLFFPEWLGTLSRYEHLLSWLPLGGQYYILAEK